jgi:hypothetical protein
MLKRSGEMMWLCAYIPNVLPQLLHRRWRTFRLVIGTAAMPQWDARAVPSCRALKSCSSPAWPREGCGFGGTFSARHPALSGAMVNDKLDNIHDCGADVLVSADCGCLLNLRHAAEKRRAAGEQLPRCVHLASVLRERQGAADAARQVTD